MLPSGSLGFTSVYVCCMRYIQAKWPLNEEKTLGCFLVKTQINSVRDSFLNSLKMAKRIKRILGLNKKLIEVIIAFIYRGIK